MRDDSPLHHHARRRDLQLGLARRRTLAADQPTAERGRGGSDPGALRRRRQLHADAVHARVPASPGGGSLVTALEEAVRYAWLGWGHVDSKYTICSKCDRFLAC